MHDNALFTVGELINPEHYGIRLRIEELLPGNRIRTVVFKAMSIYGKHLVYPFVEGEQLTFRPGAHDNSWQIENPEHSSNWFFLDIHLDGAKYFEHYR